MAHSYVVTSKKPSAVHLSVVCRFTSPTSLNLILAKSNHLEVHTLADDALVPLCDTAIYGRVCAMDKIRLPGVDTDCLFVLTELKHFCVLRYHTSEACITTIATGNLNDRNGMDTDGFPLGRVDPENSVLGLLLHEGLLKVVPVEQGRFRDAFNLRMDELSAIDVCFLHGYSRPTLCVLHQDYHGCRHVKTYAIDLKERELSLGSLVCRNVEHGARLLIPVPAPANGVIVVGHSSITYLGNSGAEQAISMEPAAVISACRIDDTGLRFLLGDMHGALSVLSVHRGSGAVVLGLTLERLGHTSIAATLAYLDNGVCFVGSCFGDSQLVKLLPQADASGSYVMVVDAYPNVGPVVDMAVVRDREGQSRLVTCSGAYKDGSIRVVRSGVGLQEQASVEVQGLAGVWALRRTATDPFHTLLLQAFTAETRVLAMAGAEMGEVSAPGLSSETSLFCGNAGGSLLVQVTPSRTRLLDALTLEMVFERVADQPLTVAVGSGSVLVLACAGGRVETLRVRGVSLELLASCQLDQDVACMSLRSEPEDHPMDHPMEQGDGEGEGEERSLLVLGMWTDSSIRVLDCRSLAELSRASTKEDQGRMHTQARSVLLTRLSGCAQSCVAVGLGDGTLLVYDLHVSLQLELAKKVAIGARPIALAAFRSEGRLCIFASCDRPTVVYGHNDKAVFSVVNTGAVACMTPFHCELFPDSLALVSETGLSIASVDDIKNINVRAYPLHEAPNRIAYSRAAALFAVCTTRAMQTARGEETLDRVLLLDDQEDLARVFEYDLQALEQALCCGFYALGQGGAEYLVVGTAFVLPEDSEPSKGRLLVFEAQGRSLVLRAEKELKGSVLSVAVAGGRLIAGVGMRVISLRLVDGQDSGFSSELVQDGSYPGHIMSLLIKTRGDLVLLGDLLCSASLLRLGEDGSITEDARDFSSHTLRTIDFLDDDTVLATDDCGNLFGLVREAGPSEGDKPRLNTCMEFHMGELANVVRLGLLNSQPRDLGHDSAAARDSMLYGCVSGAIVTVVPILEDTYAMLAVLQKCMRPVAAGVGGLSHDDWRNFHNERRTGSQLNAIDGDVIETFLELGREDMERVVRQLNLELQAGQGARGERDVGLSFAHSGPAPLTVADVLRRVEELASMH